MNRACMFRRYELSVQGEKHVSTRISQRFFSLMVKAAFIFEPLAPRVILYYLTQRLKEWKKQGLISEFETKTRRLGKFHYKIEVYLDVTSKQALHVLDDLLPNQLKSVRRWFNA
jgi:hypothetical protein